MSKQALETFNKGILLEKEAQFERARALYEDLVNGRLKMSHFRS